MILSLGLSLTGLRKISGIALARLPSLLLDNNSLAACSIVGLLTELTDDTLSTIAWYKVSKLIAIPILLYTST